MTKWRNGKLMKQLEKDKLCCYCMGCNKLLLEQFEGVRQCKNFKQAEPNWQEKMWKELKK